MNIIPNLHKKLPEINMGSFPDETIKNRLILIGNGFDLSIGLDTRFSDLIKDYLIHVLSEFFWKERYEDKLLKLALKQHDPFGGRPKNPTTDDVLEVFKKVLESKNILSQFKSKFFENCYYEQINWNWVNIEVVYFRELSSIFQKFRTQREALEDTVMSLNSEFEYLKTLLISYLKKINDDSSPVQFNYNQIISLFTEKVIKQEVVTLDLDKDESIDNLHILNFNYTNTLEGMLETLQDLVEHVELNYIHGNLTEENGEPIFGFGDEFDRDYIEFENQESNELFRHIKSFEYLKADNYYNLLRFIDSDNFQVHIYGHSCGVTDRTMLNHIFEHENCRSIKIFYHQREDGTNDYTEKSYEISRHFKVKGDMRAKVVPFNHSKPMPNLSNV